MKETLKHRGKALSLALLVVFLAVTMLPTTALAAPKKVPSKVNATKVSASSGSVKVRWNKTKKRHFLPYLLQTLHYKEVGSRKDRGK